MKQLKKQKKTEKELNYPIVKFSSIKNKPWVLVEPFYIKLSNGDNMYIFNGYWTDFASIPKFLKLFLDHLGEASPAYLCHDYLYNFSGYKTDSKIDGYSNYKVSRKFADKEMKYQMLKYGASKWRANLYYIAVRLFGWRGFGKI